MTLTRQAKPFVFLFGIMLFILGICISVGSMADNETGDVQYKKDPAQLAIFEGITPCDPANPPAPQIPDDGKCEMMIWHLTLYHDPETGNPTTYVLGAAYGMSKANTTGIGESRRTLDLEGEWAIVRDLPGNPDAVVYELKTSDGAISFVKISDDLLHILTPELRLLVGHGAWSYTLNRTDVSHEADPTMASTSPMPESASLASLEDMTLESETLGSETLGVFEGRTPCADVVYHLMKFDPDPKCVKIKWRLTLYQDPKTGQPTTYEYKSVQTNTESIGGNTGTWKAVRAPQIHGDAILYQLDVEDAEMPVFFLRVGEDHLYLLDFDLSLLVGDAIWSYTLSKVD